MSAADDHYRPAAGSLKPLLAAALLALNSFSLAVADPASGADSRLAQEHTSLTELPLAELSWAEPPLPKQWGYAVGLRTAGIPYKTDEHRVNEFMPLMYYDGDLVFLDGLSGGLKLWHGRQRKHGQWQLDLLARYRYFDIPARYQNEIRGNSLDAGLRLGFETPYRLFTSLELMSDSDSRSFATLNSRYRWRHGAWDLEPWISLRYKSARFNDYYYGLDGFSSNGSFTGGSAVGAGADLSAGAEIFYHVSSNLYLLARAQLTTLDANARNSAFVDRSTYGEVFFGFGFMKYRRSSMLPTLTAKPYLRLAHGIGTPSDLGEILTFDVQDDPQNSQITSLFYGHPLSDSLFGSDDVDTYLTLGYVYHHPSRSYQQTLQPGQGINDASLDIPDNPCDGSSPCTLNYAGKATHEYALGYKVYIHYYWPKVFLHHWRLGLASGFSYIKEVSDLEKVEMDEKGYRPSKLMQYIDLSVDLDLGRAFNSHNLRDLYLGLSIHHRSSVFETSSAFGRIKGGSNFNTVYLQYHF